MFLLIMSREGLSASPEPCAHQRRLHAVVLCPSYLNILCLCCFWSLRLVGVSLWAALFEIPSGREESLPAWSWPESTLPCCAETRLESPPVQPQETSAQPHPPCGTVQLHRFVNSVHELYTHLFSIYFLITCYEQHKAPPLQDLTVWSSKAWQVIFLKRVLLN